MGKSRLLEEFTTWLDLLTDEIVFVQGRARQGTEYDAFSLIRDAVAGRFEILDTDSPRVVEEKLSAGFGDAGLDWDRATQIGRLLGFEVDLESLPSDLEAQATHELGSAAFVEWAAGLASANPLVVILDDTHWADDPSLDLAARLVTEPGSRRILVVCGARSALQVRRPHWQEGEPRHQRIDLRPLGTRESQRLVTDILTRIPDLPGDLRDTVVSAAEGNPFHVEELIKMLIEDGVIVKSPDAWTVAQERLVTVRVPETLVGVLQARIDSLTPEEKSVLHRAAVIGRSFWDRAVVALGDDADGYGIEEPLKALRVRELVYGREASSIADAAEYVFKHAVLREVAYQSVLRRYRREYHARAAVWLASVAEANERAEEFAALIAAHLEAAEDGRSAAVWYLRAGRAAASRYANAEALVQLGRSADLVDDSDLVLRFEVTGTLQEIHHIIGDRAAETVDLDTLAGLADALDSPRKRIDVELRRARQATDMGRQGEAEAHARRAVEMTRGLGDDETASRALKALGAALLHQGSPAEAVPLLNEALDLAGRVGIDSIAADALYSRGVSHHALGRYDDAEADYQASAQIWRRAGDRARLSSTLNSMGILAFDREEYAAARSFLDEALAAKKSMGDRLGENKVLNNLALVALAQHDYETAWAAYEGTMEIARQIDDLEGEAASFQGLGQIALRTGRVELANENLIEARRLFVEEGDRQGESQTIEQLAQVAAAHGETAAARAFAEQAVAIAAAAGLSYELAASLTMLARLDVGAGNLSEAESNYRRALELHQELGSRGRLVEARAGLAEVMAARGRRDEARQLVDEVLDHFRRHGADGIDEPVAAMLACRRALGDSDKVTATELLSMGGSHVEKTAARITDPDVRRSFVEGVEAHRQVAE
jgi:tetratricopeptide (TPR) repeat protein